MTRPTSKINWASDANYPAGSDAWSGQPNKVAPSAGKQATGQVPASAFPSPEYNYILNHSGAWRDHHDDLLVGPAVRVKEDFAHANLNSSIWVINDGAAITIVDDSASGAFGAVDLEATVGDPTQDLRLPTYDVGTGDYRMECRLRPRTFSTSSGGYMLVGVTSGSNQAYFRARSTTLSGRWAFYHGTGPTEVDSGVVVAGYQTLVIQRLSGVLKAYIDGVEIFSGANTADMSAMIPQMALQYEAATQAFRVDYNTFFAAR